MTVHDDATDSGCSVSGEHDTLLDESDIDLSFLDRKSEEFLQEFEKRFNPYEERDTSPKPFLKKRNIEDIFSREARSHTEIGSILAEARKKAGLTQQQVAASMGFSEGAVRRMEKGHHKPNLDSIERYAQAVGLEISYEFTGTLG